MNCDLLINWKEITDQCLIAVPINNTTHPFYWEMATVDICDLADRLCTANNLPSWQRQDALIAVFCWVLRNYPNVQTSEFNNQLYLENVVLLSPERV